MSRELPVSRRTLFILEYGSNAGLACANGAKDNIVSETDDEKKCWQVIQDLEAVAVKVQGSAASWK